MTKTIYSKREELICGKIDKAQILAQSLESIELVDLLSQIRYDAIRMEFKLIQRKQEAEEYKNKIKE